MNRYRAINPVAVDYDNDNANAASPYRDPPDGLGSTRATVSVRRHGYTVAAPQYIRFAGLDLTEAALRCLKAILQRRYAAIPPGDPRRLWPMHALFKVSVQGGGWFTLGPDMRFVFPMNHPINGCVHRMRIDIRPRMDDLVDEIELRAGDESEDNLNRIELMEVHVIWKEPPH